MMMQPSSHRRQPKPTKPTEVVNYFSPATSTNRKPTIWSPTTSLLPSESEDLDDHFSGTTYDYFDNELDDDQQSWSRISSGSCLLGRNSSEMMMLMVKEQCRVSSYASCNAFSMGSLMDKCPKTPSPICSPLDHSQASNGGVDHQHDHDQEFSFAAPNQSSCIVTVDGNVPAWIEQEQEPRKAVSYPFNPNNARSRMKKTKEAEEGLSKKKHKTLSRQKASRYTEPSNRYASLSGYYADDEDDYDDDDGRLAAIIEEHEEARVYRYARHPNTTPRLSSESCNSGDEIESIIEEHIRTSRERSFHADHEDESRKKNRMAAKLSSWKEAKTMKIKNKLRNEEAAIDQWEKKKSTRAKMDMKEREMKLEKIHTQAILKMQRKIQSVQKEAENRKALARAEASSRIAMVNTTYKKTAETGKLSCWCYF